MGQVVQNDSNELEPARDKDNKPSSPTSHVRLTQIPKRALPDFAFEKIQELITKIPLHAKSAEILSALRSGYGNNFGIIASTGTGKSIVAPILAALETGERITVYVSKRSAAYGLAAYVSSILGTPIGTLVGYSSGSDRIFSKERDDKLGLWDERTKILYTTYGVGALYEHYNKRYRSERTIFLDEIHDPNIETLHTISALMRQKDLGAKLQLIPMSADWNTEKLSNFFDLKEIIQYNASRYPITTGVITQSTIDEAASQIRQGNTVLYYERDVVHCKRALAQIVELLKSTNTPHQSMLYHAQASPHEKRRINNIPSTPPAIILSTDAAQDSLTLEVDVVINTGLVKRPIEIAGREELVIEPTTETEDLQRKGRLGRLANRNAIYFFYGPEDLPKLRYPTPLIQRIIPVTTLLMLKERGSDFKSGSAHLIDQPTERGIQLAEKEAKKIEAIYPNGEITPLGRDLISLGLQPTLGALIFNAVKRAKITGLSQQEIQEVKFFAARAAAIYSVGHLTLSNSDTIKLGSLTKEDSGSDLFRQIAIHRTATHLPARSMEELGLIPAKIITADSILSMLISKLSLDRSNDVRSPNIEKIFREALLLTAGPRIVLFANSKKHPDVNLSEQNIGRTRWRDLSDLGGMEYNLRDDTVINPDSEYLLGIPHGSAKFAFIEFGVPFSYDELTSFSPSLITSSTTDNSLYDPIFPARYGTIVKSFGDFILSSAVNTSNHSTKEIIIRNSEIIIKCLKGEEACGPWGLNRTIIELRQSCASKNVDFDKINERLRSSLQLNLTGRITNLSEIEAILKEEIQPNYNTSEQLSTPSEPSKPQPLETGTQHSELEEFLHLEEQLSQSHIIIQNNAALGILQKFGLINIATICAKTPADLLESTPDKLRPLLSKAITHFATHTSEERGYLTRDEVIYALYIASKLDPNNSFAPVKASARIVNNSKNPPGAYNIPPDQFIYIKQYIFNLLIAHFDKNCELSSSKLCEFEPLSVEELNSINDNCDLISRLSQLALQLGTSHLRNIGPEYTNDKHTNDKLDKTNNFLNWAFWCAKLVQQIKTDNNQLLPSSNNNPKIRTARVLDELNNLDYQPPEDIDAIHLFQDITSSSTSQDLVLNNKRETPSYQRQVRDDKKIEPITTLASEVFGYQFSNPSLLTTALSELPRGEILLNLSTRVDNNRSHTALRRAISALISESYPQVDAVRLSIMLDFVYRADLLSLIYSKNKLENLIEQNGGVPPTEVEIKYCDLALKVTEIIFNQIELDSDISKCTEIARALIGEWIPHLSKLKNPKEILASYCTENNLEAPKYLQRDVSFKDGATICTARVILGKRIVEAKGPNLASAELQCARDLLAQLNIVQDDAELVLSEIAELEEGEQSIEVENIDIQPIQDTDLSAITVEHEEHKDTTLDTPTKLEDELEKPRIPEQLNAQELLVNVPPIYGVTKTGPKGKTNISRTIASLFISDDTFTFLESLTEQESSRLLGTFSNLRLNSRDIETLALFLTNNHPSIFGTDPKSQTLETTVRGLLMESDFVKNSIRALHYDPTFADHAPIRTKRDALTAGEIRRKVTSLLTVPTIRNDLLNRYSTVGGSSTLLDFIGSDSTLTIGLEELFNRAVCFERSNAVADGIERAFLKYKSRRSASNDQSPDPQRSELLVHKATIAELISPNQSDKFVQLTNDVGVFILDDRVTRLSDERYYQTLKEVVTLTKNGGMIYLVLNNQDLTPGTRAHFLKAIGLKDQTQTTNNISALLKHFGTEIEVFTPSIQIAAETPDQKKGLIEILNFWIPKNSPLAAQAKSESYLETHAKTSNEPGRYVLTISQTIIAAKKVSRVVFHVDQSYREDPSPYINSETLTRVDNPSYLPTPSTTERTDRIVFSDTAQFTQESSAQYQPKVVKEVNLDQLMSAFTSGEKLKESELARLKEERALELYKYIHATSIQPILIAHQEIFPEDNYEAIKMLGDLAYLANLGYLPTSSTQAIKYFRQEILLAIWRSTEDGTPLDNSIFEDLLINDSSAYSAYEDAAIKFFKEAPLTPLISVMQELHKIDPILSYVFRSKLLDNHTPEQIADFCGLPVRLIEMLFSQSVKTIGPKGRLSKMTQTAITEPTLNTVLASPIRSIDAFTKMNQSESELRRHSKGAHHFKFSPLGELLY